MNPSLYRPWWPLYAALCLTSCSGDNQSDQQAAYDVKGRLNDTGVMLCASSNQVQQPCPQSGLPAQDAEFGRDIKAPAKTGSGIGGFDWSKLSANGSSLAIQSGKWNAEGTEQEGTRWSCVRDHVTGLIWEVKESAVDHPRYSGHTYRWWLESEQLNGGFPDSSTSGTCTGLSSCDTQTYLNWINQTGLCGFNDWRLPSVRELSSIAVLSKVIPAVDPDFFPDVMQPRFFTRESLAKDPSRAWYVYFSDGSVSSTNKGDASHVRLVRGGQQ